eukprot:GHUV01019380.1.p1 GENE.GHUV01019380.1~~GHUV01019380.1.p1  ORF type:complete len:441 (+),score=107.47 GHUV01019380.1:306-1628(+)
MSRQLFSAYQLELRQALCRQPEIQQLLAAGACHCIEQYSDSRSPIGKMSLPPVLSPTKQPLLASCPSKQVMCSPTRQPLSPCNINANRETLAPAVVKRSLAVPQAFSSSAGSGASRSPAHKWQENIVLRAPACVMAVHSPATPSLPHQQPSVVGRSSSSVTGHQAQQRPHHLRCSIIPHITSHLGSAAVTQSVSGHSQPCRSSASGSRRAVHAAATVSTLDLVDQVPGVLDVPPRLEQTCGLDHLLHSRAAPHQHQDQHRTVMSGRRVHSQFDVPLGVDWLTGADVHEAELGAGKLELIMGPMFAGKSTRLMARVQDVSDAGRVAVAVKSAKDERYGCHWVVTHDGRCMRCYTADTLQEFKQLMGPHYQKLQVLAIDEAQFFPDLLEFCRTAVDFEGKHVIVAGLSGDFKRQRFGQLLELMPLADSITQLASKCAFCEQE